jgi:hypothetical protein
MAYDSFHRVKKATLDSLKGKRVRVTIVHEGVLERPDYGDEIMVNCCGAVRYFKKDHLYSVEEI